MKRRFLSSLLCVLCTLVLVGADSCWKRDGQGSADESEDGPKEGPPGSGDSFTLRVRTAGLVAMVPSTSGKSLGLLMVDAGAPARASNGCTIPVHVPTLEWEAGECESHPTGSDDPCAGSSRVLSAEDLQIQVLSRGPAAPKEPDLHLGALSDPSERPAGSTPQYEPGPHRPDHLPAEWVVRLGELYPEDQVPVVNESCFSQIPGSDCPVVARLRLDHGTVRTCRLAEFGEERETATFGFKSLVDGSQPAGFTPRAVGAVAEVAWDVEGAGIEVVVVPFGAGEAQVVTLRPDDEGEIILKFLNLPDEEGHGEDTEECDATMTDFHFESIYAIAAQTPEVLYVPYVVDRVPGVQPACALLEPSDGGGTESQDSTSQAQAYPGDITACANGGYQASAGVENLLATGFGG